MVIQFAEIHAFSKIEIPVSFYFITSIQNVSIIYPNCFKKRENTYLKALKHKVGEHIKFLAFSLLRSPVFPFLTTFSKFTYYSPLFKSRDANIQCLPYLPTTRTTSLCAFVLINLGFPSVLKTNFTVHVCSVVSLCNSMDCSLPVSSVHEIFQARVLKWVAISSSWGFSQPRDQDHIPCVSCISGQILYH